MFTVRYVREEDKDFWYSLDRHLPEEEFDKKVRDGQGYILLDEDDPVGIMRYNLFWDNTPFCTMLYIREDKQDKGLGKHLMKHWEEEMRGRGYKMLLTSTQVDEDAQHFYRKLGYKDCGCLTIDYPGLAQPMEMLMSKGLDIED